MIVDGDGRGEPIGTFVLVSVDGRNELLIRVPASVVDDFRCDLAARGFRLPVGGARSALGDICVATAANPAAWTAVGGVVVAFLRRHRGKVHRIDVEGRSVSVEGYSAEDAEALAAQFLALARERHPGARNEGPTIGGRAEQG